MKKHIFFFIAIILFITAKTHAQDAYSERARKYVEQYYPLAIAEQKRTGIPASITLGQGILETEAGASELMTEANNHFGIKCNNTWSGLTFLHDDDAPGECFKKYSCAEDSYRDHSTHLKTNKRYAPLFLNSTTDYASWAVCLRKCGYATNPQYAKQLIKIIEDFKLQEYTYAALDSTNSGNYPAMPFAAKKTTDAPLVVRADKKEATPIAATHTGTPALTKADDDDDEVAVTPAKGTGNDNAEIVNGMKAFYAYKGDPLVKYADKYHIRYSRLLEMNDMPDGPLPFDCYVYLEKKLTYGTHENHKVNSGETILMISQTEGIQYKKLLALNQLNPNEEPVTGTILELQKVAAQKPEVKVNEIRAHKNNAIVTTTINDADQGDGYIAINKSKTVAKPHAAATNQGDGFETTNWPETSAPPAKKKAVAKTTDADKGDGFETTNWPETTAPPAKKKVVAKAADANKGDGFETTNWPETSAPPAKKPVAAKGDVAVKNAANDVSDDEPEITEKENNNKKTATKKAGAKQDDDDDLADLKSNMDKVVYADNSKLAKEKVKQREVPTSKPAANKQAKNQNEDEDSAPKYYTIKKGETAFSIAKRNNMSVDDLLKLNKMDAKGIKAGYKIKVKG
jgi:LysM repeat protein